MSPYLLRLVAPLITCLFCLDFSIRELVMLVRGRETSRWAKADGVIVHSEVVFPTYGRGTRGTPPYPSVIYRYSVDGVEYHGAIVGYSAHFSSTNPFARGQHVKVHYDPSHPARAVLEPGVSFGNYVVGGLGVVALAFAIWWLAFSVGAA